MTAGFIPEIEMSMVLPWFIEEPDTATSFRTATPAQPGLGHHLMAAQRALAGPVVPAPALVAEVAAEVPGCTDRREALRILEIHDAPPRRSGLAAPTGICP